MNTGWLCYLLAESRSCGRFHQRVNEEHDEKGVVSQNTHQTIAPNLNTTMRVEVVFESLLMVLHALRRECEKSMELTTSSHRSFLSSSRESIRTRRLCQSQSPLGFGRMSNRGSHPLFPNMTHNSCHG